MDLYTMENLLRIDSSGQHGKLAMASRLQAQGPQDWAWVRCPWYEIPRKEPWFSMASVQEFWGEEISHFGIGVIVNYQLSQWIKSSTISYIQLPMDNNGSWSICNL